MSEINERFARLGELAPDQLNRLHIDITSVILNMVVAEGTTLNERERYVPFIKAYRTMVSQVRDEAQRRGMLYLDEMTFDGTTVPVPVVPFDVVVRRIKELESSVDKLMREVACGR